MINLLLHFTAASVQYHNNKNVLSTSLPPAETSHSLGLLCASIIVYSICYQNPLTFIIYLIWYLLHKGYN